MSSNRSKPTDRGAASPKPSRKVALDEVLRTLQDLVQHELDVGSLPSRQTEPPPVADGTPPAAAESAATPEDTAIDALAAIPISDTIVLETPVTPPDNTAPPAEAIAVAATPDDPALASTKRRPARRASDQGVQQELPHLDAPAPAPTTVETPAPATATIEPNDSDLPQLDMAAVDWSVPPAEPATTRDAEMSVVADELPNLSETPEPAVAEPEPPAPNAPQAVTDDSLHDIPVLEDAVDFHHEPPADSHAIEAAPAGHALPAAGTARRLAIQVAARLNVTLRKEGKPVLSSELIARLAHELEEALAKGGANMENSPSEKH